MENILKKKYLFTIFLLFLCALMTMSLILALKQDHDIKKPIAPQGKYWEAEIKKIGAEKTYIKFKDFYKDKEFPEQHTAAHLMGTILYQTVGISGFSICDPSFAFGCYHSFLGQAITEKGISIVSELAQKCKDSYGTNSTGCEHGIGHGILEHLGPQKLREALATCSQTNQVNPLFGCTSGLFMEYNSAIIFEKETVLVQERRPNQKNLHEPCDALVPEEFRPSCYHEISLWWKNAIKVSDKEIGILCSEAKKETEQEACYRGWGAVVAEKAGYITEKISEMCESGTTIERAGKCKIGALMRLVGSDKKDEAKKLCAQNPVLRKEVACTEVL